MKYDYVSVYPKSITVINSARKGVGMTEEEKARLDLLANCIIEDSERTTLPGEDVQALHAEIARLQKQCERYRQCLITVNRDFDDAITRIGNALGVR